MYNIISICFYMIFLNHHKSFKLLFFMKYMAPIDPSTKPSKEAYNHGMALDPEDKRVQCCYCGKIVSGFNDLQRHLGGIRGNILECSYVPAEVEKFFKESLASLKVVNLVKEIGDLDHRKPPIKRLCISDGKATEVKSEQVGSTSNGQSIGRNSWRKPTCTYYGRLTSQKGYSSKDGLDPNSIMGKRSIGRFFIENGIDFSAIESPSFNSMMGNFIYSGEMKRCIPSIGELKGWIFEDEFHEIEKYVKNVQQSWLHTGCSILLDGWTDSLGRSLVNVIVHCPEGPIYLRSEDVSPSTKGANALQKLLEGVMEEVGIQNVVQIVAHTLSDSLEEVGKLLIEKFKSLFWTISATHCISLILDKLSMNNTIKLTLDKSKIVTRFIYSRASVLKLLRKFISCYDLVRSSKIKAASSFLTLENILEQKSNLKLMFTSSEWLNSFWASTVEGTEIANLIRDGMFWGGVTIAVKASIPLIRAISLINGDGRAQMGFLYETMDQVKETICEEFGGKKSMYTPFWSIIDEVWNTTLHSPLHAAGYFLNPRLHYTEDFLADTEVSGGLLITIVRMAGEECTQDLITLQLKKYTDRVGDFKKGTDDNSQDILSPATWWLRFGGQCPDLQKIAIKVLSQTCNGGEVFGLQRHLAEKLLSSGGNSIEQKRLHNLAYIHYNLKLKQSNMRGKFNMTSNEIDLSEDWVIDKSDQYEGDEYESMQRGLELDAFSGSMTNNKGEASSVLPKVEPNIVV